MKKVLCLLLCMTMMLSLVIPAAASENDAAPEVVAETDTPPATTTPVPTQCSHSWESVSSSSATCTTDGVAEYRCGKCGATKTETTPATGHTLGAPVHVDEATHKRSCACGYAESSSHTLTETVTTAATCVSAGVSSFSCPCGYSFTKEFAATGVHTYTEWSATVETHSHQCAVCQKSESGSHIFTERVDQPATCKEEGVIAEYCATCTYIVYEVIPKLTTHTYDNACDAECNVCGVSREIEHQYQQWRTKGATGHWYACTVCQDKGDFEKHYPGPAATEEKDQICLTCGYVMTPKLNHKHNYANTWTSDNEGHWYACSGCEDQKDFHGHEYHDSCDPDCNICGYQTDNAHTFDGIWQSDEEGHWFICSVCNNAAGVKAHTSPKEVLPEENQYCIDCGYMIAEAAVHVHIFDETWKKDDLSHWQECSCTQKDNMEPHSWQVIRTEDGLVTYSCARCMAERTEEVVREDAEEFPWGIILAVLVLLLIAAVTTLVFLLKPKKKGRFHT